MMLGPEHTPLASGHDPIHHQLLNELDDRTQGMILISDHRDVAQSYYFGTLNYLTNGRLQEERALLMQQTVAGVAAGHLLLFSSMFGQSFPILYWHQRPKQEKEMQQLLQQSLTLMGSSLLQPAQLRKEPKPWRFLLVIDSKDRLAVAPLWKAVLDQVTGNGQKQWGHQEYQAPLHIKLFSTIMHSI
jgi:hypothetical protein